MAEAVKPGVTLPQIVGIVFGFVLSAAWLVSWSWIQDQSLRLRSEEKSNTEQVFALKVLEQSRGDNESRLRVLEQWGTAQEAKQKALEPYSADDRLLLKSVATQVNRQDEKLQYVVNVVGKMNETVQNLATSQVALQRRLEASSDFEFPR